MSASIPEHPTCRTCPFWVPDDALTDCDAGGASPRFPDRDEDPKAGDWSGDGECHRRAPGAVMEKHGGPLFAAIHEHSAAWTRTHDADWCGDHPGFAAFVAARYQRSRPRMEEGS